MMGPVAYMDPGTGSLFLQLLLGGLAGAAVALKLGWRRLLGFFGLSRKETVRPAEGIGEEAESEEPSTTKS